MIKNFVIPPNAHLELSELGTAGFFALGQIYKKNEKYAAYVDQRIAKGDFVILDSGVGDHDPISNKELFEMMVKMRPSEVIPLDTLFNMEETLNNLDEFIDWMKDADLLGKIQILGVPQGTNKEEWLECYEYMLFNPHVDTIGISKLSSVNAWYPGGYAEDQGIMEARHNITSYLLEHDLLDKPLHHLGMGSPLEYNHYIGLIKSGRVKKGIFRSTDSCNSVLSGSLMREWTKGEFERTKTPADYFDQTLGIGQYAMAHRNAKWFQTILNPDGL